MKINLKRDRLDQISSKKKFIFSIIMLIMVFIAIFAIAELLIRLFGNQSYMYPRWKYSSRYGSMLFENCTMIQACPGKWKFTYAINEDQYRGRMIPISNSYEKENIIILGDSYSFGHGVNDGKEYAAIMANKLKENYDVINLSVGGWGLTQQIRRYYEFGQLYSPKIVILQFCSNDPEDNLINKVTLIRNGRFIFQNSNSNINWIKKYLSKSIIQKCLIYNLIREPLYQLLKNRIVKKAKANLLNKNINNTEIIPESKFYIDLLELFAKDLNSREINLLIIAVGNKLDSFPYIKENVFDLDSKGLIDFIEIIPWFENVSNYGTPEGHSWGKKAHYILGTKLSEIIKNNY